jgi:hypothetical protein
MRRTITIIAAATAALALATVGYAAKPPKTTKLLTASAKPFVVTFPQSTTISGKLTTKNNAGVQVSLAQDPFPYGDGFGPPIAVATTDKNGNYSFHLVPATNTNYRVSQGAIKAFTGARVRVAVSLRVSDSTPAIGQLVRFFGSVRPKHDGRVVLIQRKRPGGAWITVRRTLLRPAAGNRSIYSTRLRIRLTRSYRARFPGDGDHLTGTSPTRTLVVH